MDGWNNAAHRPVASASRAARAWPTGALLIRVMGIVAALSVLSTARAAEIHWRPDYISARREAAEKCLPLFLDFSTENCYWCRRLEASTFRDPKIIALLNERFIPLRLDGDRDLGIAQALRISAYPTLVLAAADGRILDTVEGYRDAGRLHDALQRALSSVGHPEWMAQDFRAANQALAAADQARALVLLRKITNDGQERPIQVRCKQMIEQLERQVAERVKPAEEAALGLADKSGARLRRARELIALARDEYRTQQFVSCIDHCELLASAYADLPEGTEAVQLADEIKSNPDWLKAACLTLSDRLGNLYVAQADAYLKKRDLAQAVWCLERVLQAFPGTRQAEAASERLSRIQKQRQLVDYEKP